MKLWPQIDPRILKKDNQNFKVNFLKNTVFGNHEIGQEIIFTYDKQSS